MKYASLLYPTGSSGTALAVLRASLAWFLTLGVTAIPELPAAAFFGCGLLALALLVGIFVRAVAAVSGVVVLLIFFGLHSPPGVLAHVLDAAALAVLGPGALSLDGVRFGRRTLRLSDTPSTSGLVREPGEGAR